ncbi:selenouridine synthase SelU-like subunit [Methanococcus aeolicus]|uniref:tRNA 2-selenouridine synthase AAA domain-containing protein n=1 Tax=Methanococcus aeolicus (strain ATCC BAA-1280 / DSM 17508 / OCM 812 / Nankai-3) TaxID=419665 RepID=A6UVI7_META3|nr:selenouridine synthase SelU-like subunit [Methanococcus aeolicus]ABR56509.1 conserved hypothetical protein [Methanococcus aeolicus Nankai-3]UXM84518.1 selenouridine synthase SelU-like subunit [Methanococcus aeolicus]
MIIFGLFGKTGCGKTEILEELKNYHPVIDIEGCGNTRGSILGDLYHLKQNDQKTFDKLLNEQIEKAKEKGYCILEFEGSRIGGNIKLDIPEPFSNLKNYDYCMVINCPYECQIQRLLSYYLPKNEEEKKLLLEKFKTLKTLFKREEKIKFVGEIIELLEKEDYYNSAKLIEEKLYGDAYMRPLKKITVDLDVYNTDLSKSVEIINNFVNEKLTEHNITEHNINKN